MQILQNEKQGESSPWPITVFSDAINAVDGLLSAEEAFKAKVAANQAASAHAVDVAEFRKRLKQIKWERYRKH